VAERYERNRTLKNCEEHISWRRQSLVNAYAMAIRKMTLRIDGKGPAVQQEQP